VDAGKLDPAVPVTNGADRCRRLHHRAEGVKILGRPLDGKAFLRGGRGIEERRGSY